MADAVEYRDTPGFPGYQVGSDGSVWSRVCGGGAKGVGGGGQVIRGAWKQLKPIICRRGRATVTLNLSGRRRSFKISRLVLLAFVGPCPPNMEACHFPDRDPSNNSLANLRWDTKVANSRDRVAHGTTLHGERNPKHRLTASQVIEARARHRTGVVSYAALAREHGIADRVMRKVIVGTHWSHIND